MVDLKDIRSKIAVGDYLLTPDSQFNLFEVSRPDGKPISKELMGRWTDAQTFRRIHDAVVTKQKIRGTDA